MPSRYVYTCVRVPVEITSDGTKITHTDRMKVSFEECTELPSLGDVDSNQAFQDYLSRPLVSEPDTQCMLVLKSEIKHVPKPQFKNSTFKTRPSSSRYSCKVRCEL